MIENFGIAQVIDAVILFTLLECVGLVIYHRRTGRGVAVRDFLANVVSGLCLMFALRCLATDAGAATVALFLLAAGVAHGLDILMRWKRSATNLSAARRANA
ncbi:MAG: hypothetical protein Q8R33_10820 [Burkholderiales bacterium]|nr:hypothetical protein [Burkholderiales bacterium]